MGRAIKTELVKYFTTRLWWGMAIAVAVISLAMTGLVGSLFANAANSSSMDEAMSPLKLARFVYTVGASMGYILLLVIGVMLIGQEFRHRTITSTFLSFPRRGQVMAAKVVAMLAIGAFYGLVYLLVSLATGASVLAMNGLDPFPEPLELLRTLSLLLLVLGLWGLMGVGLGVLIPNQVAAIITAIGLAWIVEPILGAVLMLSKNDVLETIGQMLPSSASSAILEQPSMGGPDGVTPLDWWQGILVLVAWAGISALIGSLLTARKDIS